MRKLSKVDAERLRQAVIGAMLTASGGRAYDGAAVIALAGRMAAGETLDAKDARVLLWSLAAVVRRELDHIRRWRNEARKLRDPALAGSYYAARPVEAEALAVRVTRDEPRRVRELRAALRLRRLVRARRAPAVG